VGRIPSCQFDSNRATISANHVLCACSEGISWAPTHGFTGGHEGQVASGDWGTPTEYIRELIRQDKERRMANLEQELLAAAKEPKIEVSIREIRKKGLVTALRERVRRA
jgi:antitoxin ParD1/3/4